MDGTLLRLPVDIAAVRAGVVALFASQGVEARPRPILDGIRHAARAAAPDDPGEQAAWIARGYAVIEAAELEAASRAAPCLGAQAFVAALGQRPAAIVTNNGAMAAREALECCGLMPANLLALVGREPDRPAKPSPYPLYRALQGQPEPLGEILVVGDRPPDMAMAEAARTALEARGGRVRALGVLGDLEGEEELRAAGAEAVFPNLEALLARFGG